MSKNNIPVTYRSQKSHEYPSVEWLELYEDGKMHECAILKRDDGGNVFFFEVNALDNIDRMRLAQILSDRNASNFELWDLMSQRTLGNGINALAYFHQLVKVLTPNGKVMDPRPGVMGILPTGTVDVGSKSA